MREAVICEPVRTPVGRYGGVFRDVPAATLAATVIRGLLERTGLPGDAVDDVFFGQCYPNGEAPAIGRVAALDAGLPIDVGGLQVDRRCGSGLQAITFAAMCVQTGAHDLVLAGGAESMSQVEYYALLRWGPQGENVALADRLARGRVTAGGENYPVPGGMMETAENLRQEYGISREEQDELALASHQRAVAAQQDGRMAEEIIPVTVSSRKGEAVVDTDEHPRADTSLEALANLPTPFRSGGTVTAGNASGVNDGAAALVVASEAAAKRHGLTPIARILGGAAAGVPPRIMGIGPVPATRKLCARLGLMPRDFDVVELNEAFASQALAVLRELGLADDAPQVNANGGAIALGHPLGMSGARITGTAALELSLSDKRRALATMCIGVGQGIAVALERV